MVIRPEPDLSFERDGRPLAAWLLGLVSDDRAARQAAAEALGGMWRGWDSFSTRFNKDIFFVERDSRVLNELGLQPQRFAEQVRQTVDSPEFPKPDFVHRLCRLRIALEQDWCSLVEVIDWSGPKLIFPEQAEAEAYVLSSLIFGMLNSAREPPPP